MKTRGKATRANANAPKDIRDPNLSKDGKWRSFPKVPNLLQYVSTGTFYGRATVDGKIYRESLKTTVFSVAKQKLPDYLKEKLRKKRQIGAPATFAGARQLYEQDLENDHALSESMKRYRRYCIKKLLDSWPGLDSLKLNRINDADCKEWAGRIATEDHSGMETMEPGFAIAPSRDSAGY